MPETTATALNVALLAPVPLEHLVDGEQVVQSAGKVAFGSRAWETFRELDKLRKGLPVDVYIYESHGGGHYDFKVAWRARYIQSVEVQDGAHPDGMKYRPPSTGKYTNDNLGHWAVFWDRTRWSEYLTESGFTSVSSLGTARRRLTATHSLRKDRCSLSIRDDQRV